MSKTQFDHVMRDDYLKPEIESRVDELNNKLTAWLDDGKFKVNSNVDGKFDFILPGKDLSKNLGVNYDSGNMPTDEEYNVMIVKGRINYEDELIDKYLNMNLISDVGTIDERRGNMVKRYRGIYGREICRLHTKTFFDTCEYDIEFTDGTRAKYAANITVENMYVHVDDEGNQFHLLVEIQEHRKEGMSISKK